MAELTMAKTGNRVNRKIGFAGAKMVNNHGLDLLAIQLIVVFVIVIRSVVALIDCAKNKILFLSMILMPFVLVSLPTHLHTRSQLWASFVGGCVDHFEGAWPLLLMREHLPRSHRSIG